MSSGAPVEIGGYLEFERYEGRYPHDEGVKLNCGRSCLEYLLRARDIKTLWLPDFLCDSVRGVCRRVGVSVKTYAVGEDFRAPHDLEIAKQEWLYLVDYYGQLTDQALCDAAAQAGGRLILDEAQNFFRTPELSCDVLYTPRKFFGIPDGGLLLTDARLSEPLPTSESFEHMAFLTGRFERTAGEFYAQSTANNRRFAAEPLAGMSLLTDNLLRSFDYARIADVRDRNYAFLDKELGGANGLHPAASSGPFAYPFLVEGGPAIRKALAARKIFIPTLWPNVLEDSEAGTVARRYARDILPLPVDQRYGETEMTALVEALREEGVVA